MKKSEITKWAKEIINTIFNWVIISEDKEIWRKAISFIDSKIKTLELNTRWEEMFLWRDVKFQMLNKFGKKFITIK